MPAWALEGGTGGGTPPAPITTPPSEGLIQWLDGARELVSASGVGDSWGDQSGLDQDVAADAPTNPGPLTGLDTIDDVPCISWALDGGFGPAPLRGFFRAGGLVDRNGNPMGYGPGDTQARTEVSIIIPRFSSTVFNITGGILSEWRSTPAWQPLFDLEDTVHPDGFYLFSTQWRNPSSGTLDGPDTPGGAGGPYNGVPLMVIWESSGFDDIACSINGVSTTLTPSVIPGPTGATVTPGYSIGRQSSGGFNFFGCMSERLIYDYKISTNPAALYQLLAYGARRYPSISITL